MKKSIALLLVLLVLAASAAAQTINDPVTPFKSVVGMSGLILEATGFGLIVGAGSATSFDLSVGLALFSIAPVASTAGAWLTQSYMKSTNAFWIGKGLQFDGSSYLNKSNTYAIVTTAFGVASLFVPVFVEGLTGAIISLVCSGVSVGVDIVGLYGPRLGWTRAINTAILESGMDWRAVLSDG
jgi:hypothetical protein